MRQLDAEACALVRDFVARQGVIFIAALAFFAYTAIRVRLGRDKRDLRTFVADASKQGGQQMMGGTMMVLLGLHLSERGLSPLAWYGGQYPFEIIITTVFTGLFRTWVERGAQQLRLQTGWAWLAPYGMVGQYGPRPGEWQWRWYFHQLVQAILLIGFPARVVALGCILLSLSALPDSASPVYLVAQLWFSSGLSCGVQAAVVLYAVPLAGDAVQFIVIDRLQAFRAAAGGGSGGGGGGGGGHESSSQSDSEVEGYAAASSMRTPERSAGRMLLPVSSVRSTAPDS